MVKHLLQSIDSTVTFETFDVEQSQFPPHLLACDAYLITGSKHSVNDPWPWISELEHFILKLHQAQIKLIGICFGHQLIAKALGGKVSKSPQGWGIGMSTNRVLQRKPWMMPFCEQFNLLMSHQDQVIELPKDTDVLASNAHCPFYMLQIGNNLTIQGHPEFTKDYSKALIEYRHDLLDPLCYEKGLQSLALPEDKRIIAQWITHFLHDKSEHD
jgi:GMP synthase-like glutamine amidotransferase